MRKTIADTTVFLPCPVPETELFPANTALVALRTTGLETVRQGDVDTYRVAFRDGEPAVITLCANGEVALFIFDREGRRIKCDITSNNFHVCVFIPSWRDTYSVRVVNNELWDVDYVLEMT